MSKVKLWNDGWQFEKTELGVSKEDALRRDFFTPVNLPHDWLIYQTNDLYEDGIGWYKKKFQMTKDENLIAISFEGVYMDTTIWINDRFAFEWKYGYSAFEFDATDFLQDGENEILLRVVYQKENSRWYSGAGIYRNVFLKQMSMRHLVTDGIYVHSQKKDTGYELTIETEVMQGPGTNLGKLSHKKEDIVTWKGILKHFLLDEKESVCIEKEIQVTDFSSIVQTMFVEQPKEWDIEHPDLYGLKTVLYDESGNELDSHTQKIGFRDMKYDPDHGFFLNGRKVRINGACEHHDLGCLGAAVYKSAIRRKLEILRAMGVNAIRTSHNMPAREWLELADEMGFLVNCEAFDMWELSKTTYDYARFFKEWSLKDVASWIRRDRNHPCVMFWSIGNEIYDTHKDEHGQEITRYLCDYVNMHDPLKNAPVTIGSNYMPWENAQKCADIVKMAGYNYTERYYEEHHKAHPDWVIYGSETASTVQSRGVYKFPLEKAILCDDDRQCSCLGNCSTAWGSKRPENNIAMDRDTEFSCGQFIWTGFDYIGEPTPYSTKNSYFGQIDTAGFPKDTYYIYQAEWTDGKKKPMVHIFPYWDFNYGEEIDVRVCSNARLIKLFFALDNGEYRLIGEHEIDHKHGTDQVASFKLPYQKGVLKAIAYDENLTQVATDQVSSFGDPVKIGYRLSKNSLVADGTDLLFMEIFVQDHDEKEVANANNRIFVEVEGDGCLLGLDNGDSTDYEPYKCNNRRLFRGKLLAVIRTNDKPGNVEITLKSAGMEDIHILVPVLPGTVVEGTSLLKEPLCENKQHQENEIPIRDIKLVLDGPSQLDNRHLQVSVKALLEPLNTTEREIIFKATNESGVDTNIVKLTGDGLERVVTALGDGIAYIKCMAIYQGEVSLISQVRLSISGLGAANINPYEFVSASLYTGSSHELGNGLERGVAMAPNTRSYVSFDNIDFGKVGSDTIILPIYELDNKPFPIEIWDGVPETKEGVLLARVIYDLPSIWSKYQEKTYVLSKRISGMHTLSIVADHNIEIKGFRFEKYERAYETNSILSNDLIYGDSFEVTEHGIEKIGNNVSITFENMNFEKGIHKLVICGRTKKEKNTIHIRFEDETGIINEIAEFEQCDDYREQEFFLSDIIGEKTVHFVFLPGSEFDFQYFRFMNGD